MKWGVHPETIKRCKSKLSFTFLEDKRSSYKSQHRIIIMIATYLKIATSFIIVIVIIDFAIAGHCCHGDKIVRGSRLVSCQKSRNRTNLGSRLNLQQDFTTGSRCATNESQCPYNMKTVNDDLTTINKLNIRSTSPWVMMKRRNSSRLPRTYYEACCVCTHCVDHSSTGERRRMLDYLSVPITKIYPFRVRCGSSYFIEHVEIAVGCTCARHEV